MKKFKELAMRNTFAACIYFTAMMAASILPLAMLYIALYAAGCR